MLAAVLGVLGGGVVLVSLSGCVADWLYARVSSRISTSCASACSASSQKLSIDFYQRSQVGDILLASRRSRRGRAGAGGGHPVGPPAHARRDPEHRASCSRSWRSRWSRCWYSRSRCSARAWWRPRVNRQLPPQAGRVARRHRGAGERDRAAGGQGVSLKRPSLLNFGERLTRLASSSMRVSFLSALLEDDGQGRHPAPAE